MNEVSLLEVDEYSELFTILKFKVLVVKDISLTHLNFLF